MRFIISFYILFISSMTFAQNEGNIWYFGNQAGLDFNNGAPEVLSDGVINTSEGCSSISDENGDLLFYTDGISVWNVNHQVMPNGNWLYGNFSSTQSSIVVRKPQSSTLYYIFTIDDIGVLNGMHYSVVDITLDGGLGDVTDEKNIPVLDATCEKITAISHANGSDFWITTLEADSPDFYSYLLDENGLNSEPVISSVGSDFPISPYNIVGYMRASPQGNKIACAYYLQDYMDVFDFNISTGVLSNGIQLDIESSYGVEFSIDGSLLYATSYTGACSIYQFNLLAGSEEEINNTPYIYCNLDFINFAALQMAPDEKIYVASSGSQYLHVIAQPGVIGVGCEILVNELDLTPGMSMNGLPTFFSSIFSAVSMTSENTCIGDSTWINISYSGFDSLYWDLGDGPNSIYEEVPVIHQFSDTGSYNIFFIGFKDGEADSSHFTLYIKPLPSVFIGEDQELCEGDYLELDAEQEGGSYYWQNGSLEAQYTAWVVGDYWVEVTVNECVNTDSIWLYHCDAYVAYPNIFTPNNDGKNDVFEPIYYRNVKSSQLQILDRWGRLKFESTDISQAWDGTFNDSKCSDGVYFFMLHYIGSNGKEHETKGTVTLTRKRSR